MQNSKFIIRRLKSERFYRRWLSPFFIALAIFFLVRPVFAEYVQDEAIEEGIVVTEVGVESVDGKSQIYYIADETKVFITKGSDNHKQPFFEGDYIVYIKDVSGAGQLYLYQVPTNITTHISNSGTNLNPKVDANGKIVWEGWVVNGWQIFLFDGISVKQISEGATFKNADIENDFVVYARKELTGDWMTLAYSLQDEKSVDVTFEEGAISPLLKEGKILLGHAKAAKTEFPLRVSDLFIIDFAPLNTSPQKASELDILEELINLQLEAESLEPLEIPEATESAEFLDLNEELEAATESGEVAN